MKINTNAFNFSRIFLNIPLQDTDQRIAEKNEEIHETRQTAQRVAAFMQAGLDSESGARNEAVRSKKKMESDFNDVELHLADKNRNSAETQKILKKVQEQNKDLQLALDGALGANEAELKNTQKTACQFYKRNSAMFEKSFPKFPNIFSNFPIFQNRYFSNIFPKYRLTNFHQIINFSRFSDFERLESIIFS